MIISKKVYLVLLGFLLIRLGTYFLLSRSEISSAGQKVHYSGPIESEPRDREGVQSFKMGGYNIITRGATVHFGDTINLTGKTSCPQKASFCDHPTIYYPELKILEKSQTSFWWEAAANTRSKLLTAYQDVLPKKEADLLSGITLGSQGLNRDLKNKLATVGLTHVVAASGMNVSFFLAGVLLVLNYLRLKAGVKTVAAILLILFYATLTGFDPPIVRAVIMAAAVQVSALFGRQHSGVGGLVLAAGAMLWADPGLIINPSFLLSFTAMTSQITLSALNFPLPKLGRPVIEIFLQSLLISFFTFPIVVIFFSNFSLISIFTNPIVLWTIEPLMILGAGIASFGNIFMPISQALALPAQGMLAFFLWVVDTFSQINFIRFQFSFSDPNAAILFAVGYYFVLASVLLKLVRNERRA
jgi:competence protein ComEC